MKTKFSNDNTSKMLGFDYQKLIALEYCLNAQKNENIWIECKGDVASNDVSIEVKHHEAVENMTSNSVDVWKTIKNYVSEYDIVAQFNCLILYTTSCTNSNSIFYNWNRLSAKEKKTKLHTHTPAESVREFYEVVKNCEEEDLLEILKKFRILELQPNILEKWNVLTEHPTFKIIQESRRDSAIEILYGYITKKAIDNSNEWKIVINDFNRDIQSMLSRFVQDTIPFPTSTIISAPLNEEQKKFIFIAKMEAINIKSKFRTNALSDYLKSNEIQIELLKMSPTIINNLNIFDENVDRMLNEEKGNNANEINEGILGTEQAHKVSQKLYFGCIGKEHESIIGVANTQKYYRDGRIHHTLEKTLFEWKFKIEDV